MWISQIRFRFSERRLRPPFSLKCNDADEPMKQIAYITDLLLSTERQPAFYATQEAASSLGLEVRTLGDLTAELPVAAALWSLFNFADVVVVALQSESTNIAYEIGLAHGLGKPVVIVASESVALPADLVGQHVIYTSEKDDVAALGYRITIALREIVRDGHFAYQFNGPRSIARERHKVSSASAAFLGLYRHAGPRKAQEFERWFAAVARSVDGWDVVESERRDETFDFVLWNNRGDYELSALGNPIPVELISSRPIDARRVQQLCANASQAGLKGLILATTSSSTRLSRLIARQRKNFDISVALLGRDELARIASGEDLVTQIRLKVRELLYLGSD